MTHTDVPKALRARRIEVLKELREKLRHGAIESEHELSQMMAGLNFAAISYQEVAKEVQLDTEIVLAIMEGESTEVEFDLLRLLVDIAALIDERLTMPEYSD